MVIFLLGHLDIGETASKPFEIIELFAGTAKIARMGKALGLSATALDKTYCSGDNKQTTNCMDINTDAGFL